MGLAARRVILGALGVTSVCLLAVSLASGQAGTQRIAQATAEEKPSMAEQTFKNIQLLRGIPVDQFMQTMGFFAASTGLNCTDCHTEDSNSNWAKYADDTPLKQTARRMIVMVRTINQGNFGGKREVTCWSCHRGGTRPQVIPRLAVQYGAPPDEEPDEILRQATGVPSPDQVLEKYVQALGGAQKLASLTSFIAKGTYEGYETGHEKVPVDIFAKAPGQRTTVIHTLDGDSTSTYDGHAGWVAAPEAIKPMPLITLTGGDLDGAKLDAELSFPARIKQILSEWRVGPQETIDDHDVEVVQGKLAPGGLPVKLYFDPQSGLLVRLVRYVDSSIGINPLQIDYADYREVSGVKMPFRWIVTWTDGRSTVELSEVKPNVPIDATKLAKPSPAGPPKPTSQ